MALRPASLDHWDMRTGRNPDLREAEELLSLDHWDMRTGRNSNGLPFLGHGSLDHWDMRTGRNAFPDAVIALARVC